MAPRSAGILLHRRRADRSEVLLVHPGGPYWAKRDAGAWSIPKGEYEAGEGPFASAAREFEEELSTALPAGEATGTGTARQAAGKLVTAGAIEGDLAPAAVRSNSFSMEWPPRSGEI